MRRSLFIVVISIFLISIASAADYTCNTNNQLFRISSMVNGVAETVSGSSNYGISICYDDYFGTYTGTPDRTCAQDNPPLIKLSATTNAHAQIPGQNSYPVDVCFRGLTCTLVSASNSCATGYQNIVQLSGNTNAHLGISPAYSTLPQAYTLCCKVSTPGGSGSGTGAINEAFWTDNSGVPISTSFLNRVVQLKAYTDLAEGSQVQFEVREDDILLDDLVTTLTATTDSSGTAVASLRITQSMLNLGAEFYFNVSSSTDSLLSGLLVVDNQQGNNTFPRANITGPVHRGIYYPGNQVMFTQNSLDREGNLNYSWYILEDNYRLNQSSFGYTFSSTGQKTIILRVIDERGLINEDQIAVLVVGSSGLFGFINQPRHQQVVYDNLLGAGFSAEDSYVVSSTGCTARCLVGNCPIVSQNAPSLCGRDNITLDTPGQPFGPLFFNWSFSDGDPANSADGFGKTIVNKRFAQASSSFNDKTALLSLNYSQAGSSLFTRVNRSFTLFDSSQCLDNGQTWVEYNRLTGEVLNRFPTRNSIACAGDNRNPGDSDDCCPVGSACTVNGCVVGGNAPRICSDYTNRTACVAAPSSVTLNPANPGWSDAPACGSYSNGTVISCTCTWNGTSDLAGSCALTKNARPSLINLSDPGSLNCIPSSCTYSSSQPGACTGGLVTIQVNAQYQRGTCTVASLLASQCVGGERSLVCGEGTIALPFFGWIQVVLMMGILAGFYAFHLNKKK